MSTPQEIQAQKTLIQRLDAAGILDSEKDCDFKLRDELFFRVGNTIFGYEDPTITEVPSTTMGDDVSTYEVNYVRMLAVWVDPVKIL